MTTETKTFHCTHADETALRFVTENVANLKSVKVTRFEHNNFSHDIDVEYELKPGKELVQEEGMDTEDSDDEYDEEEGD